MKDVILVGLLKSGFSKNEAKVYTALLELGSVSAGKIAIKSGVHRTNVYDALDRLIEKGLVSYIYKGKTRHYAAEPPGRILKTLEDTKERFKKILPLLALNANLVKTKDKAHIFEGVAGIKAITEDILRTKPKEVLTFGVPKDTHVKLGSFINNYHKKRIKLRIMQRHLYDEDSKDRIKELNKIKYTEAAYIPREYNSPTTTTIYGDKVAFWIWSENPVSILVESERMADSYRRFFKLLWNMKKK